MCNLHTLLNIAIRNVVGGALLVLSMSRLERSVLIGTGMVSAIDPFQLLFALKADLPLHPGSFPRMPTKLTSFEVSWTDLWTQHVPDYW